MNQTPPVSAAANRLRAHWRGVYFVVEELVAKNDQPAAQPWSEPQVFHDGGMTPLSEYEGDDAPDASTVGVVDESSPAAVPPRAAEAAVDADAEKRSTRRAKA